NASAVFDLDSRIRGRGEYVAGHDHVRPAEMDNAVAIRDRIRLIEHFHGFAIVEFAPPGLYESVAGPAFGSRLELSQARLDVLMPHDGRALSRIRELPREKRSDNAGVVSGGAKLRVTAREVGMEAGVDDELDRLLAQFADRGDHLVRDLSRAGVDHHRALVA